MGKRDHGRMQDLFDRVATATPKVKKLGWAILRGKCFPAALVGSVGPAVKVVLLGRREQWTVQSERFLDAPAPYADPARIEIMNRVKRVMGSMRDQPASVVSLAEQAGMSIQTFASNLRILRKIGWVMTDDVRFKPGQIPPGESAPVEKPVSRVIAWRNPNLEPE